jgi:ribosome recycling factor
MEALHGEISDDEIHRSEKQLQEVTDSMVAKVDDLLSRKESELLEV